MRNGKKILSLFLAVMMLICSVPLSVSAGSHTVTITLNITDYLNHWSVNGFFPSGNNYSENASITVSCIDSDGNTTSKKIIVGGSTSGKHTLTFSGISFLNSVKFDFSYLQIFGLGEIIASVKMNNISLGDITINSSNKTVYSSNSFSYNTAILDPINTTIYKAYYVAKFFPSGYDFDEDSYDFGNYVTEYGLSEKYFTTMYENGIGKLLCQVSDASNSGLCFGMAFTTASFNRMLPSVDILRNIKKRDKIKIGTLNISADDFIKYSYVYQFSSEHADDKIRSLNDVNGLLNTVNSYKNDDLIGVEISLYYYTLNADGQKEYQSSHSVLAVGSIGNTIIINDSNNYNGLDYLTINKNGSWSYSGTWNSKKIDSSNSDITYSTNIHRPFVILATGNKTVPNYVILDFETPFEENYIVDMENIDRDKVLLHLFNGNIDVESDNCTPVNIYASTIENADSVINNGKLYWISENTSVTVSEFTDEINTVELAGDNTLLSATVSKDSTVTMTINETDINTKVKTKTGDAFETSFNTITDDDQVLLTVSGVAASENVTATQTETGILVTGISDGTITLTKNEEVIATQKIGDVVSDVEIIYDAQGEIESLDVDYETDCKCYCHKDSWVYEIIVMPIFRFIWKLFGVHKNCFCGIDHY